jgi:uncharacterized protein YidB (DUF937 family)
MGGLGDLLKGAGGSGGGGGLGDLLGGILGGSGGGSSSSGLGGNPMLRMLLPLVASMLMNGGLQKILGRLRQSGSSKGQSWVSAGPNEPADAADIKAALDDQELAQIAQQLGVSEDEAAEAVAQVLPDVVDQATPDGELPDDAELDRKFGRLHELDGVQAG